MSRSGSLYGEAAMAGFKRSGSKRLGILARVKAELRQIVFADPLSFSVRHLCITSFSIKKEMVSSIKQKRCKNNCCNQSICNRQR